jgi:hypothetical protein
LASCHNKSAFCAHPLDQASVSESFSR